MKKSIIAGCIALALCAVAHAENWIMVMESTDGTRLLVDIDSFGAKNWPSPDTSKPGVLWINAKFMYYSNEGAGQPFLYTTKYDSCKSGNGELVSQLWDGAHFVNKDRYWWSNDGQKMYDAGGMALCAIAKTVSAPAKKGAPGKDMT